MPRCVPERPLFTTATEQHVWELLRDRLRPARPAAGEPARHLTSQGPRARPRRRHRRTPASWWSRSRAAASGTTAPSWRQDRGGARGADPPRGPGARRQVRAARLRRAATRAGGRRPSRVRWAHAVVLPHTSLPDGLRHARTARAGRSSTAPSSTTLAGLLRDIPAQQESRSPTAGRRRRRPARRGPRGPRPAAARPASPWRGARHRGRPADRAAGDHPRRHPAAHRVEVRGGAGSGKTWLAIEQARRLAADGQAGRAGLLLARAGRVPAAARGDACRAGTSRRTSGCSTAWASCGAPRRPRSRRRQRLLGAAAARADGGAGRDLAGRDTGSTPSSSTRRRTSPTRGGRRCWRRCGTTRPAALRLLRRGAARLRPLRRPPVPLVPLMLDHNLRNTRQIADTFTRSPRCGCGSSARTARRCASSRAPPRRRSSGPTTRSTRCSTRAGGRRTSRCSPPAAGTPSRCERQDARAGRLLGVVLGHRAGVLRPRARLQGPRAPGRRAGAERVRRARPGARAPVRRAVAGPATSSSSAATPTTSPASAGTSCCGGCSAAPELGRQCGTTVTGQRTPGARARRPSAVSTGQPKVSARAMYEAS